MTIFTPFKKATGAATPDFSGAAYAQGRLQEDADARESAANSANLSGGVDVYNQFMGDNTPIRDYGRSLLGIDPANAAVTAGDLSSALAGFQGVPSAMAAGEGLMGADLAAGMVPEAMGALGMESALGMTALPEIGALGSAAGAGGAGAAGGIGAAMPMAGAALLLANLFGLF